MHGEAATYHVGAGADRAFARLTTRQLEVLALMAEGRSNAAIARSLLISEKAVVQHTSQIYERLDIAPDGSDHRRVLAVLRYLSHALAAWAAVVSPRARQALAVRRLDPAAPVAGSYWRPRTAGAPGDEGVGCRHDPTMHEACSARNGPRSGVREASPGVIAGPQ